MLPPRRRETFIALRATRTAHRFARDVLNPHLDVPEFQREILNADEVGPSVKPARKPKSDDMSDLTAALTYIGTVALLGFLLIYGFVLLMDKLLSD